MDRILRNTVQLIVVSSASVVTTPLSRRTLGLISSSEQRTEPEISGGSLAYLRYPYFFSMVRK